MAFFLTLLYVLMVYIRPMEWVDELKNLPVMDVLAFLSIAVAFLTGSFTADKFKRSPVSTFVMLFWFSMLLSHAGHFYFTGVQDSFIEFAKIAIIYFMIIFTVDTLQRLRVFLWAMALMAIFLAVQGIVQYYTGSGWLVGGQAMADGEVMRVQGIGIFGDPNHVAINIVPLLALGIPAFHKRLLSPTWVTGLAIIIPIVIGAAFTRSRGGLLGLAALGWYYLYRRTGPTVSVAGLIFIMFLLVAIPRMGNVNPGEGSARSRLDHWSYGLSLFRSSPIFGVGMHMFTEGYSHTAHNSLVLVLAELGILGTFAWLGLFFFGFRDLVLMQRLPRPPPWLDPLTNALIGALISWQVCAFFLSQAYRFLPFALLGLISATLNVLAREGYVVDNAWTSKQTKYLVLMTLAAAPFMLVILRLMWAVGG